MRNGTSGAGVVVKANLGTRPNVSSSVKSMQQGRGGVFDIVARHGGRAGGEKEEGGRPRYKRRAVSYWYSARAPLFTI